MIVVYKSKTGYTKKYAQLLAQKLNIECYELKGKSNDKDIIFCGHIMANKIQGLDHLNQENIVCVVAVGLLKEDANTIEKLHENNKIDIPLFYLRGGLDYTQLKGASKMIMKMIRKAVLKDRKKLTQKEIEVFEKGGEFFEDQDLIPIVNYLECDKV